MDNRNRMLIDASHPEETRVVVLRDDRVEEFDYESALRKQLRGNIYLAKITRVEPSLQAAFVDYGGNRHGFLAFSEIHPDYYQIPVADREALLKEEAEDEQAASVEEEEEVAGRGRSRGRRRRSAAVQVDADAAITAASHEDREQAGDGEPVETISQKSAADDAAAEDEDETEREHESETGDESETGGEPETGDEPETGGEPETGDEPETGGEEQQEPSGELDLSDAPRPLGLVEDVGVEEIEEVEGGAGGGESGQAEAEADGGTIESVGSEDALEEVPQRRRRRHRFYKIQEVIKRRQIVLVQVVKEERGNKGAALTTYLSLAGRYTVLMPNTARGGGISRKITNPADRKRLRKIATELDVSKGMGLIIRTAGASRTKAEINRDFEYLLRLWENVRDLTLQSTAPTLVYEEGDLIKRSIRDLYSKDIEEVLVAGDEAYKEAKEFMRMLTPSHAKNVKPYKEAEPLFTRFQIERQLNAMFSPIVTLRSGGYLVINQTEALVAIDVNSGKATREHSIEETALQTNLETAEEIARQLKLRDLAGLIVIDFIDMEERRNNRAVERRLKDFLRHDRARIQVGRISHFGLLEMSRQRLRTGVLEGSTSPCPHCQGTGLIRSTESVALSVLRALEEALIAGERGDLTAITSVDVSLYILNQKRPYIKDMEARYGVTITVTANDRLQGVNFSIEKTIHGGTESEKAVVVNLDWVFPSPEGKGEDARKCKQRRKRHRRIRSEHGEAETAQEGAAMSAADSGEDAGGEDEDASADTEEVTARRPRRRGRRGGRKTRRSDVAGVEAGDAAQTAMAAGEPAATDPASEAEETSLAAETESERKGDTDPEVAPARSRRHRSRSRNRTSPRTSQDALAGNGSAEIFPAEEKAETGSDATVAADTPDTTGGADATGGADGGSADGGPFDAGPEEARSEEEPNAAAFREAPADSTDKPSRIERPETEASSEEETAGAQRRGWWQHR